MNNRDKNEVLITYCQEHPDLQIQDVFKFLFQSVFGCEHLIASPEKVTAYIKKEYERGASYAQPYVERLDGRYSRVGLSYLGLGLSAETLGRLMCLSAQKEADGEARLAEKLDTVKDLIKEKKLPFSEADFEKAVSQWSADGYPAIHHSDRYREKYSPSYRVIANRYIPFLPLFAELDKRLADGRVRLAVEGSSASGKTTLGKILCEVYDCTLFHADDFFLRPEQRTPDRFAQVGGNLDRERLLEEVLIPLEKGEEISYRRFDCAQMVLQSPTRVVPERLTVVEGAYSMHPELAEYYDFSVFLEVSAGVQKQRILKRNPQMAERFFYEWIPLENKYFCATDAKGRCDLCIRMDNE